MEGNFKVFCFIVLFFILMMFVWSVSGLEAAQFNYPNVYSDVQSGADYCFPQAGVYQDWTVNSYQDIYNLLMPVAGSDEDCGEYTTWYQDIYTLGDSGSFPQTVRIKLNTRFYTWDLSGLMNYASWLALFQSPVQLGFQDYAGVIVYSLFFGSLFSLFVFVFREAFNL